MKKNNSDQYDKLSKSFHWMTAITVVTAFILGPDNFGELLRDGIEPSTRNAIVWHESLGILVFILTFVRLFWLALRPAAPRLEMSTSMKVLSRLIHFALWSLLLALPITALLALGTESHPLTLLGGFRMNELPFSTNPYLSELTDWGDLHKLLGNVIMWLAGTHALAALYHYFRLKDKVLQSMLP